jgi:hypothetical protein
MKSESVREEKLPEASDDVQGALADKGELHPEHAPNRRADALSLDPYSPIAATSADVTRLPPL